MSANPKKKPTQSPYPRRHKPTFAPHDGPFFEPDSNPFPVPLDPLPEKPVKPLDGGGIEWWWNPNSDDYAPVKPGLPTGHRYASISDNIEHETAANSQIDYDLTSILGMGPEDAKKISSKGKGGGGSIMSIGSGKGK